MPASLPADPCSPSTSPAERHTRRREKEDEWSRRYGDKSIPALFWEQAGRTPDAPAIRDHAGFVTYRQLAEDSERLAVRLQACGIVPGDLIVVETVRSRESITALIAILTAGGAYLALDRESPPERFAALIAHARPALILRQGASERPLPKLGTKILDLDAELRSLREMPVPEKTTLSPALTHPRDLAYVSLTSGSTGAPKGVCIPHRGVVRLVKEPDYVSISPSDVILRFSPLSFDASTFEIWGALLNGACLAVFPPERPSLREIGEFIEQHSVSLLWLTAGIFHQMADGHLHHLHGVRQLIVGGDVLSASHVRTALHQLPHCRIINGYGPTENTTFTCCHTITSVPAMAKSIPIGRPIHRTYCRVLDAEKKQVTPGVPGELYIGGDGLALGYLGDPSLTEESFIDDPFSDEPGARLYRSGDRVRELANGSYAFLGRIDRQVKVSGVRVELDEIEAVLAQHPLVSENEVHLVPAVSGYEQLAATVALRANATASQDDLRDFLRTRLPAYMIPTSWTFLPSLPLTAHGKLDRASIQAMDRPLPEPKLSVHYQATTEETLIQIWREVLGYEDFGLRDNFFDLGGTSLRATHLLARIQTVLSKNVPMSILLEHATIAGLVHYLDQLPRTNPSPLHIFRSAGSKPALFILPSYAGDLMCYANMDRHFAPGRPAYAVQSQRFMGGEEEQTIEGIAATCLQAIVRQRSTGPYHLFGFCFGGLLAYEVACQLAEQGAEVGMVAALDYEFPDPDPEHSWARRPGALFSFTKNLILAGLEFFRMPRADRNLAFHRMAQRAVGLFRGKSLDEALRSGLESAHPTEKERLDEVHENAWRTYVPRSFPGRVTLLRAGRLPVFRSHDPTLGWSQVPVGSLDVKIVGGGWHGAALQMPHATALTSTLEKCMVEAERASTIVAKPPTPIAEGG